MSESNNNIPMRITQLEEATAYEDGMYYAVAKAGYGTNKIDINKLTPSISTLLELETISEHTLLTETTPLGTYGNACSNAYLWIAKQNPIPKGSIGEIGVLTANTTNSSYKLVLLKKNSETNYSIVKEYDGIGTAVKIDKYTIYASEFDLYIGLYSSNGAICFSSNDVGTNDNLVRNTYQSFIDGEGTSDVSDVSAPLNFSYSLTIKKSGLSLDTSFPVCIVDKNGNGDYTTIQEAIDNTSDGDTILIMPSTYFEQVKMWGKNRHLVGISKENTIIASTSRYYNNEPLQANIGSIKNLTLIGGYGLTPIEGDTSSTSYALHIEYANPSDYEFVIDNCYLLSNVAPAIGMGVRYNQTVKVINSKLETKAKKMWSSVYSEFFNIGGIFCHNDASGSNLGTKGRLEVTDCELKGIISALTLQSQNNGNTLNVRFVNNLLWSEDNGKVDAVTIRTTPTAGHIAGSDVILDAMSFGNNIDLLNA